MTERVAAASLIVDFTLYPRNQVDDTHIADLRKALASGVELPPLIVERGSNRIVDGVHRKTAHLQHFGDLAIVPVEFREYVDEAALFLEAVRLNAGHGRRLDRQDQTRIVLRLQELHVEPRVIAMTLHVPEQEVRTLSVRIVYDTSGAAVPLKRGMEHLRGQTLSDEQLKAAKSVRSAEVGRICMELNRLLENELVDYTDPQVHQRLKELAGLVASALKRCRAVEAQRHKTEKVLA